MPTYPDPPFTALELALRDGTPVAEAAAPANVVTASTNIFVAEGGVELVESDLHPGAVTLVAASLQPGLPVRTTESGKVSTRSLAERREAALLRGQQGRVARVTGVNVPELREVAPYRPAGIASGQPKVVGSLGDTHFGISASGSKTLLSEAHSTIIDGESRSLVYPDVYPYTAVCKLYVSYQPNPGAAYVYASEATGFMIGPRTMMTAGHVRPPAGKPWSIQVIPACWNGQSVFGAGLVSYVSDNWLWNSDSGSDIQVCRLYDPIGDTVGWFGTRGYSSSWEDSDYWTMAGFPYDINLTHMSHETAIAVRDDDDGDDINVNGSSYDTTQVESDADEASGVSGAPLWGSWDDGAYAIGIHHGVERDGTIFGTETYSCAAGGDGFLAAARWARGMWG